MMFRTHIAFALLFYFLFLKIFSISFIPVFALILCFGSILPDIDSPSSFVNVKYLLGVGKTVSVFSKHRGFWHSIFGCMIFSAISFAAVYFLHASFIFALALPAGYLLHLAADSFNVSGIKWLWKSGRISGPIRTGGIFEQFFFLAICAAGYFLFKQDVSREISAFLIKP
ncbi:MAG: metal-dependent hydrolase [Candidatus Paceibacterota bacterium]